MITNVLLETLVREGIYAVVVGDEKAYWHGTAKIKKTT